MKSIQYKDRDGIVKEEKVPGENYLKFIYSTNFGKFFLESLIKQKFASYFFGKLMDLPSSKKKIAPFIKEYNIDEKEFESDQFSSFNDFFIRRLKESVRPINSEPNSIISPADGKILVFPTTKENKEFSIKGIRFNLKDFLKNKTLYNEVKNGSFAIIRLAPADYHRFHFPIAGNASNTIKMDGDYYSVSPIALKEKLDIFLKNKRHITFITNEHLGKTLLCEVGATFVGSIIQTYTPGNVKKGQEKGYFKFGGSTVIIFFSQQITFDSDLIQNTRDGFETEIKMGERIALY